VNRGTLVDTAVAIGALHGHDPREVRHEWAWRDCELLLLAHFNGGLLNG
jgi:hypothetical protein